MKPEAACWHLEAHNTKCYPGGRVVKVKIDRCLLNWMSEFMCSILHAFYMQGSRIGWDLKDPYLVPQQVRPSILWVSTRVVSGTALFKSHYSVSGRLAILCCVSGLQGY
jgi:hypothetical protein